MHVHSDLLTDRFPHVECPRYIPRYDYYAMQPLIDYANDRMSIAVNIAPPDADADLCRHRLCHWWLDLSSRAVRDHYGPHIVQILNNTPLGHYPSIGRWLDGKWSRQRHHMTDLLWRMQMTDRIVAAAAWLHDRGMTQPSDEDSRDDQPWPRA